VRRRVPPINSVRTAHQWSPPSLQEARDGISFCRGMARERTSPRSPSSTAEGKEERESAASPFFGEIRRNASRGVLKGGKGTSTFPRLPDIGILCGARKAPESGPKPRRNPNQRSKATNDRKIYIGEGGTRRGSRWSSGQSTARPLTQELGRIAKWKRHWAQPTYGRVRTGVQSPLRQQRGGGVRRDAAAAGGARETGEGLTIGRKGWPEVRFVTVKYC